jgi:hypothetical protein
MKPKKCKNCGEVFDPQRAMQKACSVPCAIELANKAKEKTARAKEARERKVTKEKLDALRTKPQLVKLAQTAFNGFIRARDAGKPCISCGTPLGSEPNTYDAGHYRSVGSAPHMRFVEDNCHGQCKHCNNYLAGNHVEYRKRLLERIGQRNVELIENDNTTRKYTKEGLEEIAKHYRAEARRLQKEK